MPSLKYIIELSVQNKEYLLDIVTKGTSSARTILRANILLSSDKNSDKYMTVAEIANLYFSLYCISSTICKIGIFLLKRQELN